MTGYFVQPSASIIQVLTDLLVKEDASLSRSRIIFSGRRPAHFLRRALAQRLGRAYAPPLIYSINDFVSEFMKEGKVIDELESCVLLAELLGDLKNTPQPPGHPGELERYTFARQVFDEFEELKFESVTPAQLKSACSGSPMPLGWYAEAYANFYATMQERSEFSSSMVYEKTLIQLRIRERADDFELYICDWIPQSRLEMEILKVLASGDSVTLLYFDTPETRLLLDESGIDISKWGTIDQVVSSRQHANVSFYTCGDRHSQLFALNAELEKLSVSATVEPDQVLIVLPKSDFLIPVIKHSLALLPADSYNISMGYPLSQSTLYAFFVLIKNLFDFRTSRGFRKQDVLSFIRHPYIKTFSTQYDPVAARILCQTLSKFLSERSDIEFIDFEKLNNDQDLRHEISEAELRYIGGEKRGVLKEVFIDVLSQFLEPVGSAKSLSEMGTAVLSIAKTIHSFTAGSGHPLFARWYSTFRSGCLQIVDTFEESKVAGDTSLLLQMVLELVGDQTCAFPGTPLSGVQVLGFLETRTLSFDTVFFVDTNDDVLPGKPAMPIGLFEPIRLSLKMKSSERKRLIQEHHFNRLRSGAGRTHYFYVENDEFDRSRFLEKYIWYRQREAQSLAAQPAELPVTMDMNLATSEPGELAKSEDQIEALSNADFSASMLDTYLDCQRKFYFKYVASVGEPSERDDIATPPDVGNLVHAILRDFFTPLLQKELANGDLDGPRLKACVEHAFQSRYGEGIIGGKFLIKERINSQLQNYIDFCRDRLREGTSIKILALEEKFQATIRGHRFIGRLDKIEQRGTELWIADYKTGKLQGLRPNWERFDESNVGDWRDSLGSLQLAVYALLMKYNEEVYPGEPVPAYVALGAGTFAKEAEIGFFPDEFSLSERKNAVNMLEAGIVQIVNEIKDINKSWTPPKDIRKQCPKCPYQPLCGTQWL